MLKQPNHTQLPNEIIDKDLRDLSGGETKVILVIARKTVGWHKETDSVSISQMQELTGLSNATCIEAVRGLEGRGLVLAERSPGRSTSYTLCYASEKTSQVPEGATSEESSQVILLTSEESSRVPVKKVHTQKKGNKESKEIDTARERKSQERRRITDYYQERFVEKLGAKPTWDGRIMKLLDSDLSRLGVELLGNLVESFFDKPTDFIIKAHPGLGYNVFHSQIDALLERRSRRAG